MQCDDVRKWMHAKTGRNMYQRESKNCWMEKQTVWILVCCYHGDNQKNVTHTEGVLYVNEPAIKAIRVADLHQFISHRPIRFLVFKEGLTGHSSIRPLCDESTWCQQKQTIVCFRADVQKSWQCAAQNNHKVEWLYISFFCICLTKNRNTVLMRSVGPHSRRNGYHVVCEVVKNVNVLPVIESIRGFCMCALDKPWQQEKTRTLK